jgi:hypothetical protein
MSKLHDRIRQAELSDQVDTITRNLERDLTLTDDVSKSDEGTAEDSDDWEALADKELSETIPAETIKITTPSEVATLELYDFDVRIQMHQLVKDFTTIVDPIHTMPFRPKMVNQSLMMTFNNPKHGTPS